MVSALKFPYIITNKAKPNGCIAHSLGALSAVLHSKGYLYLEHEYLDQYMCVYVCTILTDISKNILETSVVSFCNFHLFHFHSKLGYKVQTLFACVSVCPQSSWVKKQFVFKLETSLFLTRNGAKEIAVL